MPTQASGWYSPAESRRPLQSVEDQAQPERDAGILVVPGLEHESGDDIPDVPALVHRDLRQERLGQGHAIDLSGATGHVESS